MLLIAPPTASARRACKSIFSPRRATIPISSCRLLRRAILLMLPAISQPANHRARRGRWHPQWNQITFVRTGWAHNPIQHIFQMSNQARPKAGDYGVWGHFITSFYCVHGVSVRYPVSSGSLLAGFGVHCELECAAVSEKMMGGAYLIGAAVCDDQILAALQMLFVLDDMLF
jgi:hypothetical protein